MYALESILPLFINGHEHGHSHQLPPQPPSIRQDTKTVEMNPVVDVSNGTTTVLQETSAMLEQTRNPNDVALTPTAIMVIIGAWIWMMNFITLYF